MGLLNDLKPVEYRVPCKVRSLFDGLDADDKKILVAALNNPEWTAFGLSKALQERGLEISDRRITHHRQGKCSC